MSDNGCKLKNTWFPLGTGVQMLGLALMAGGMLALGAFTAPVVFGHFPREAAAPMMAMIFRRYDLVLLGAMALVWLGEWLRWLSKAQLVQSALKKLRYALLALLTGSLLYSTQVLNAEIERMNHAGLHRDLATPQGQRFERTHKLSEGFYKLELLGVALLILLTPFVSPRVGASLPSCPETPSETGC